MIFKRVNGIRLLMVFLVVVFMIVGFTGYGVAQTTMKKQNVIKKKPMVKPMLTMKGDLTIRMVRCPKKIVKAGENLAAGFVVEGKSTFAGPVKSVVVDLILTSSPIYPVPAPIAVYSPNYSQNVLLMGGREHVSFSGPGTVNVKLNGNNKIPVDTPPGTYYLGAVIDAGNKVSEANERNNVAFCKIKVINKPRPLPDLVIPSVTFKKVQQRKNNDGTPYWIFNVLITVKNRGNGPAGPCKVLLERNTGPGGKYTQACISCVIDVPGLAAGQSLTLPPRQFNNSNNAKSLFRATADSTHIVTETNERNNMNATNFK